MGTDDGFRALLASARRDLPAATWEEPEDLVRYGVESLAADEAGDARVLPSSGLLRLHGAGVVGHAIDLEEVGAITSQWQRAVTAVGASIEDFKSSRGKVPRSIASRTRLVLQASPGPGSVVLRVSPRSSPLDEVEPGGARPLVEAQRPLADRATEMLLDVVSQVSNTELREVEGFASTLVELGPRVASALEALASTLSTSDIALEASWREPSAATRRASWSSDDARWLCGFIAGRELDAEVRPLVGEAATVSNRERWLIETEDGIERVRAERLTHEEVRRVRSGDRVTLRVRSTVRTHPDGTTTVRHEALELLAVDSPDSLDDE